MNHLLSRPAPPITFIEFMGLPGSGKSTIAAIVEADLRRYGINITSRSSELADNAPFLWRHYKRFVRVVRNARRCRHIYLDALKLVTTSRQSSPLDLAKVTWNFWNVIAFMTDCRAVNGSVTIVDQGLFQAIWSIQLSSCRPISAEAWNKLLRSAGIADVLVVNVRSEIPVASNRLSGRAVKRTRLKSEPCHLHIGKWQLGAANLAALYELAHAILPPDQSGERVIIIDSDERSPRVAAAEVTSAFLARTRPVEYSDFQDFCANI